jgi:hypothetical protein
MSKYKVAPKAQRTLDNIVFDSKTEMNRYKELTILAKAGVIQHLEIQPEFKTFINQQLFCTYTADFRYYDEDRAKWIIEDVKSNGTIKDAAFKLRKKAAELYHGVEITIILNGKPLTSRKKKAKLEKLLPG